MSLDFKVAQLSYHVLASGLIFSKYQSQQCHSHVHATFNLTEVGCSWVIVDFLAVK